MVTRHHLDLKMVQLVTTRMFLLWVKRLHFHSLCPESWQGASHEFFWHAHDGQRMSNIFFHMDVTLVNGSILQGGGWPSVPWYPDTPETGAATQDLSWFIKICCALFPRVHAIKDFPYPNRLHLAHHTRLQKTSDILLRRDAYVEYPLSTEQGTCTMATGISEKMGGPHIEDSLSPWPWTNPPSLSCLCPFCNKSHNSRDSLMNHV